MQDTTEFRANRDLFSNHYLDHLLPESDPWVDIDDEAIENAYTEIRRIYDEQRPRVEGMNEAPLEEEFIKPVLDALGHTYAVQEEVREVRRYPDYAFFADKAVKSDAYDREDGDETDFYRDAVAVGDAKRWGRKLDKLSGERRNFSNPSHQINVYLQETPAEWAILTNGKCWRLYYAETSRKLDSYYEVDLEALLEDDDCGPAEFEWFYNFFRARAFVVDASGESFLDRVYDRSATFARELGEDLEDNIYEAIRTLAEGFLSYPGNDLSADDLDLVHDSSLVYLYRLLFVFYAESEGRDLLDTQNRVYNRRYSLNTLKAEVREELTTANPEYTYYTDDLWHRLENLFELIDRGSESRGIPREEFYVPAYNGGLFRTEVDAETSREIRFLQNHEAGDTAVARVIDLLARRDSEGPGTGFVDYSSLDIRHLGSIYEGLLEYDLNVAGEPLAVVEGEYVPVAEADGAAREVVEEGAVYLTTDTGERKATGSYYTPEYVVQYIVENTLDPLLEDIRGELHGTHEENFAEALAERVFDLKILDPAMGSGHFLTNVVDHLANEIVDAQAKQGEEVGEYTVEESHDIHWARRQVVQRCVYGVDVNPLAVELAKVSLWLRTLAAEQPLAFLDHHLKTGNSLMGSDIEEIDELDTDVSDGPNASLADFGAVRRGTIDHLMDVYEEFIAIENTDLADVKEMERRYREIERDDLRTRLVAMANVETAEDFGLDLPSGAYERMARALDSTDEWAAVAETDWFRRAQALAAEHDFLHWKLEFPEVFYEVDGSDRANPGFDAVVGNPPYVSNWGLTGQDEDLPSVLEQMYPEVASGHWDLYVLFSYHALSLTKKEGGLQSFITPSSLATEKYGTDLREYLITECDLKSLTTFDEHQVFEDVDRQYLIYLASPNKQDDDLCQIVEFSQNTFRTTATVAQEQFLEYSNSSFRTDILVEDMDLKSKIDEQMVQLGHFCCVNPGIVAHSAEDSPIEFHKEDVISEEDGAGFKKYISGSDIDRHEAHWQGLFIDYDSKREYFHRPKFPALFESPKIMFSGISGADNAIHSCYDEEGYYTNHNVNHATLWTPEIRTHQSPSDYSILEDIEKYNLAYLAALVNSKLIGYYFDHFLAAGTLQGSYTSIYPEDIRKLPIKEISFETESNVQEDRSEEFSEIYNRHLQGDYASDDDDDDLIEFTQQLPEQDESDELHHDALAYLLKEIVDLHKERNQMNLSLADYIGTYADGEPLGESYQPPVGLKNTILHDTAKERDSLKFETITVSEDGPKLVIRATARYKPENPQDHETKNGYTETEPIAAMEFIGLSETERALIREFVPYAVAESRSRGRKFAGFKRDAGKTIKLIKRLKDLTLPVLDDVESDLKRYQQVKLQAEELDEKIEKTDELIDQIVYELYGLTDEEVAIVDEAVSDD